MAYWSDRPATAHIEYETYTSKVYEVGRYEITVPTNGDPVTYRADNSFGRPQRALPNMEIVDGVIKIAISDLVDEIMDRASSVEIAMGLFENVEIRQHFVEMLAGRWAKEIGAGIAAARAAAGLPRRRGDDPERGK